MRFTLIILLSLLVVGCDRRDAKLRKQIYGSWNNGIITYLPDGIWHFHNELVISNVTLKWASDGTWDVKDGFLITTITNSIAENTTEKPSVGSVSRSKINFVDEHNLAYGNEKDGASYHR